MAPGTARLVIWIHGYGITDPTAADTVITRRMVLLWLSWRASLLVLILILPLLWLSWRHSSLRWVIPLMPLAGRIGYLIHFRTVCYVVLCYPVSLHPLELVVGKAVLKLVFIGGATKKDQYHRKNQWCDN